MAKQKEDQRAEIRFCVRQGLSRVQTRARLIQAHAQNALSISQVNRWYSRFSTDAAASLSDLRRSKGPRKLTPQKIQEIGNIVQAERRSTLCQITARVGVAQQTVHKALTKDLNLRKRPAKWVPHLLTDDQKNCWVDCARRSLAILRQRGRNPHIICGDESWFWTWEPESKQGSRQWIRQGSERPQIVRKEQSTPKVMLICFFDLQGVMHHEWVLDGHGIDRHAYLAFMINLREAVRRRRPEQWRQQNWVILHDNVPAHRAGIVQDWLRDRDIDQLPHPGYSPDLSPQTTGCLPS